jgi:hypothetical protein
MTETGEQLETVRILNDRDVLAEVMSRAGEAPEVVLEADVRVVLGRRCARGARRDGAPGASARGQGVLVSAGQK